MKRRWNRKQGAFALIAAAFLLAQQPARTVCAQEAAAAQTEDKKGLSGLLSQLEGADLSELNRFVEEKLSEGAFEDMEALTEAVEEGCEKLGVSVSEKTKAQIAEGAQELYETYGEELTDHVSEFVADQIAGPVGDAIKEQVVEPAKEAAVAAVKETAAGFWRDLKDSVVSFLKDIFS